MKWFHKKSFFSQMRASLSLLCLLCFLCSKFVCTIALPFCTMNIENLQHIRGWNWRHPTYFFSRLLLCCFQPAWWACGWALTSRLRLRIREETAESATVLPHGRGLGGLMLCNSISLVDCLLSTFIFHSWPKHTHWAHLDLLSGLTKHCHMGKR